MKHFAALFFAVLVSALTIAATSAAQVSEPIRFTLHARDGDHDIDARFWSHGNGHNNDWNSDFAAARLPGLDLASFRAAGAHPLRFAVIRDSGRLDCAGQGGNSRASGDCRFSADPAFAKNLAVHGIRVPSGDSWLGLFALDVRRSLVDAVAAARYPTPTVGELISMTAVGVSGPYIQSLAQAGYRPKSTDTLVQFKAIGIESQWIGGLTRAGYGAMPGDQLVQLKALGVDGPYIQSFTAIGYRHLTAEQLVQMKALGVTADFARRVQRRYGQVVPARLVELRALGFAGD